MDRQIDLPCESSNVRKMQFKILLHLNRVDSQFLSEEQAAGGTAMTPMHMLLQLILLPG